MINSIIIHCTGNKSTSKITLQDIRQDHRSRGWSDIGYHYVIFTDGRIERGRPISQPGAHCKGRNAHSIGIAYVGGIGDNGEYIDTRTPDQKMALLKLITNLTVMYRCKTFGHNHFDNQKHCPCFDAENEYKGIYNRLILRRYD